MSTYTGRHRTATTSSHTKTFAKVALTGAAVGATGFLFAPGAANAAPISEWDALAQCESGGRWDYNGSSGYDGGLQFHPDTWTRNKPAGYPQYAWQASAAQQIEVGKVIQRRSGWGAWPSCSAKLGLP